MIYITFICYIIVAPNMMYSYISVGNKNVFAKVIGTKSPQVYEIDEINSNGNLICYLTHAVPVFSGDAVVGITLIVRDHIITNAVDDACVNGSDRRIDLHSS